MMAGHCLLFVISSFVFGLVSSFGFLTIVPISLVYLAVFVLEFAIAFLQAYVFTILMIIYLNDSLHPGH
jgi:F-type H+-transporting ATPase subunit a